MPFRGKVGAVVGSSWRGIPVMRYKGPSKRNNNSAKQLDQQAKFSVAIQFASTMSDLFKITYKNYAQQMTARNNAVAEIVKNAIVGTYPAYTLDHSKILISRGKLKKEPSATMTVTSGTAHWQWTFNGTQTGANGKDRTILVVYCPFFDHTLYQVFGPERLENAASLDVSAFLGHPVHTWLSFITVDTNRISDSMYTGTVVVS